MATTAATMGQIASSSAGSPDIKRFGGGNTTGSISGGTPAMGQRRGGAKAYAHQGTFQPTGDITGAMQQSDKIMFKPVEIPGMMPNAGVANAYTGQGNFAGNKLDAMIPMPMTARKAIARSPFSHSFSDTFVPSMEPTVSITPTCEELGTCPPDVDPPVDPPPPTTTVSSGGGEGGEEPEESEPADPMGFGMTPSPGKGKGSGRGEGGKSKGRSTAAPASGPHGGGMSSSESAESSGFGSDPLGEMGTGHASSASGEGEGSKVICGELHRQGLMSDAVYKGDLDYQTKHVSEHTKNGYLLWAKPVSRLMRRSKLMTQVARPFASAWAEEMAYRANGIGNGNVFGTIILATIAPVCTLVGKIAGPRSKKALLPA